MSPAAGGRGGKPLCKGLLPPLPPDPHPLLFLNFFICAMRAIRRKTGVDATNKTMFVEVNLLLMKQISAPVQHREAHQKV